MLCVFVCVYIFVCLCSFLNGLYEYFCGCLLNILLWGVGGGAFVSLCVRTYPEFLSLRTSLDAFVGRLKVNMGNIYFRQKNYPKAVKFYRMALDQVPNTHKEMRYLDFHLVGMVWLTGLSLKKPSLLSLCMCLRMYLWCSAFFSHSSLRKASRKPKILNRMWCYCCFHLH